MPHSRLKCQTDTRRQRTMIIAYILLYKLTAKYYKPDYGTFWMRTFVQNTFSFNSHLFELFRYPTIILFSFLVSCMKFCSCIFHYCKTFERCTFMVFVILFLFISFVSFFNAWTEFIVATSWLYEWKKLLSGLQKSVKAKLYIHIYQNDFPFLYCTDIEVLVDPNIMYESKSKPQDIAVW